MNTRNNRNSLDWIHFSFGAVVGAIEGARAAFSLVSHWWSIVLMIVGLQSCWVLLRVFGRQLLGIAFVFRLVLKRGAGGTPLSKRLFLMSPFSFAFRIT